MKWSQVKIIDNKGDLVADPANFVLDHADGVVVMPYARDTFGLKVGSAKAIVDPDGVQTLLRKELAGKARSVTVDGATVVSNVVVPARHVTNTVNVQPQYRLTLELGDVDALFGPLDISAASAAPWNHAGVRQRLQALGYLYTALPHSQIAAHAEKCWHYYAMVHGIKPTPQASSTQENTTLLTKLRAEVQGNLVMDHLPASGEVGPASALPAPASFAAIRVPGGYCMTWPRAGMRDDAVHPTDADHAFDHTVTEDQHKLEESIVSKNPLLFKLPLVAKVVVVKSDGGTEPAKNITVHFQLIPPATISNGHALDAAPLRDTVMDVGKNWAVVASYKPPVGGVTPLPGSSSPAKVKPSAQDWLQARNAFQNAYSLPPANRDSHIGALGLAANAEAALRHMLGDKSLERAMATSLPPYEISKAGQQSFVANLIANLPTASDPDDPQRTNAPAAWCGRAGEPVEMKLFPIADAVDAVSGVAVDLQARIRANGGPDTAMPRPSAIPSAANPHKHAVKAVTNDKGQAGVIFSPSRCGGDRYCLRAYVGPDSWNSTTATPPEAVTGTLVVWRNIRLYRYYKQADVFESSFSPTLRDLLVWPAARGKPAGYFGRATWAEALKETYADQPCGSVGFGRGPSGEGVYARTIASSDGMFKKAYRPVDVDYPGFAEVFAQCFCEWIMDTAGPTTVTDALHGEAIREGILAAKASGSPSVKIDWETLIFHDPNSPFVLNLRHYLHYNYLIKQPAFTNVHQDHATYPALTEEHEAEIKSAIDPLMINRMLSVYAEGGVYPGLTLIQFPRGDTWHQNVLSGSAVFTTGVAGPVRAAFVFGSDGLYRSEKMCYSLTSNSIHELGHALMGEHQFGDPLKHQGLSNAAQTTPKPGEVACVMSYSGCYGEFCGKCIMRLRGWKIKSDTEADGV